MKTPSKKDIIESTEFVNSLIDTAYTKIKSEVNTLKLKNTLASSVFDQIVKEVKQIGSHQS